MMIYVGMPRNQEKVPINENIFQLRAYPNNRLVMRPSEKSEARAAGQKGSPGVVFFTLMSGNGKILNKAIHRFEFASCVMPGMNEICGLR